MGGGAQAVRAQGWEWGDLGRKAWRGWSILEAEGRGEVEAEVWGGAKAKLRGGANSK